MPPEIFPPTLQKYLDRDYSETQKPRSLSTENSIGPTKKRLIYTKEMPILNGKIIVDMTGYQTWKQWYNVTISAGIKSFYYNHPITQIQTIYRFSEEPVITAIGPLHFNISFTWEQL